MRDLSYGETESLEPGVLRRAQAQIWYLLIVLRFKIINNYVDLPCDELLTFRNGTTANNDQKIKAYLIEKAAKI